MKSKLKLKLKFFYTKIFSFKWLYNLMILFLYTSIYYIKILAASYIDY